MKQVVWATVFSVIVLITAAVAVQACGSDPAAPKITFKGAGR